MHQVAFRSSAFPPDPSEQDSGVGGTSLAFWVAEVLAAAGIETGEPFPEDYGWMVGVHGPGRVVVTCAPTTAELDEWSVVVEDVPRRFRKPDPAAGALVARTVQAVHAAIASHPGVTEATWLQGGPAPA